MNDRFSEYGFCSDCNQEIFTRAHACPGLSRKVEPVTATRDTVTLPRWLFDLIIEKSSPEVRSWKLLDHPTGPVTEQLLRRAGKGGVS